MLYDTEDTIVAVSSAPGSSARGILRISGPESLQSLDRVFHPQLSCDSLATASWSRCFGCVDVSEGITVAVKAYSFPGPRSYTGQDMVELHVPGSAALLQMLLQRFLAEGCRLADPGEFTARAFLSGRLDLSEAEAVGEVIAAQSDAQLRAAQRLLDGDLHRFCGEILSRLTDITALVEAHIDFSQEEIEFASPEQLQTELSDLETSLATLLRDSVAWEQLEHLPHVVLAGAANAGKSTLANALLGIDRSVVSQIAGTTRDILTAPLQLTTGECLLMDTAGLGAVEDILAGQSQMLTQNVIAACDLLLWVFDASADQSQQQHEQTLLQQLIAQFPPREIIFVANKIDQLPNPDEPLIVSPNYQQAAVIAVSALTRQNLPQLLGAIEDTLHNCPQVSADQQGIALTARQRHALQAGAAAVTQARQLLADQESPELLALELRTALDELGAISGQVVPDDVLDRIFSRFCVGK
ncbi:MAG: tRNA uridine-5-carboxymethylaminomethyl(34) synthesis GTPase MnmE [Sedimentisphaerales bacterium]|nr:tRNA uridine-5-carboxymethylaminomethyl(34) synthesis GTPase MnmE [Sedimentisphaerales bacterium]